MHWRHGTREDEYWRDREGGSEKIGGTTMNDMKVLTKILVAIRESQKIGAVNFDLISEKSLGITEKERDDFIIALLHGGLIEGITTSEDIDNAPNLILWHLSHPRVTVEGIKFMSNDSDFKKAIKEIIKEIPLTLIGALCSKYI